MNAWDTINEALRESRDLDRAIKNHASGMVDLLTGRLRGVHPWKLTMLKRELRDFNIHTQKWKS